MGFLKDMAKLTPIGMAASLLKGKDKTVVRPTFITSQSNDVQPSLITRNRGQGTRPPHVF